MKSKLIITLASLALMAATLSACDGGILAEKPKSVGFFYRLEAHYTHIATGDPIDFDFIVACNVRITNWRGGDASFDGVHGPTAMIKPLPDGGAIFLRSFAICRPGDYARMSKDPFPSIIVYDDANDLSFGFGYVSEDAYQSPRAKVKFLGARISPADQDDFDQWQRRAEAEYRQVGQLPGPLGYWMNPMPSVEPVAAPENKPRPIIGYPCYGYRRLKLPDEILSKMLEIWPADVGRYWMVGVPRKPDEKFDAEAASRLVQLIKDPKIVWPDGLTYANTRPPMGPGIGVPRKDGSGFLNWTSDTIYPSPQFPFLPRSKSAELLNVGTQDNYPRILLVDDSWQGFVACEDGGASNSDHDIDVEYAYKTYPFYINDELVGDWAGPSQGYQFIIDKNGFLYDRLVWG